MLNNFKIISKLLVIILFINISLETNFLNAQVPCGNKGDTCSTSYKCCYTDDYGNKLTCSDKKICTTVCKGGHGDDCKMADKNSCCAPFKCFSTTTNSGATTGSCAKNGWVTWEDVGIGFGAVFGGLAGLILLGYIAVKTDEAINKFSVRLTSDELEQFLEKSGQDPREFKENILKSLQKNSIEYNALTRKTLDEILIDSFNPKSNLYQSNKDSIHDFLFAILSENPAKFVNQADAQNVLNIESADIVIKTGSITYKSITLDSELMDEVASNWREILDNVWQNRKKTIEPARPSGYEPPSSVVEPTELSAESKSTLERYIQGEWVPDFRGSSGPEASETGYNSWDELVSNNVDTARELIGIARALAGPSSTSEEIADKITEIARSKGWLQRDKSVSADDIYSPFTRVRTRISTTSPEYNNYLRNFNNSNFEPFREQALRSYLGSNYSSTRAASLSDQDKVEAYNAYTQEEAWRESAGVPKAYDPVE